MTHAASIGSLPAATALHLVLALAAAGLGPFALAARKGGAVHRTVGRIWVLAMTGTAVSAIFVTSSSGLPSWHGFSPIHALVVMTLLGLGRALWAVGHGDIAGHRSAMRQTYYGACLGAGAFTLLPGRYLGDLLWHHALGWI